MFYFFFTSTWGNKLMNFANLILVSIKLYNYKLKVNVNFHKISY